MKNLSIHTISLVLVFALTHSSGFSQTVVNTREADLKPGGYPISGNAFLEELDNGNVQLRLSEDYQTSAGPDVQIFLANSPMDVSGAFFVEDIGDTRKFSGSQTWNLGTDVGLNEYNYIIFRCVAFGLHWANGNFGDEMGNGGGGPVDTCVATIAATTAWNTEVDICPNDGSADIIPLLNTLDIPAGDKYAYVLTDKDDNIIKLHFEDSYDFEDSGTEPIRVYGISYRGNLTYNIGEPLNSITSDNCIIFSDQNTYLTVTKNGCAVDPRCFDTNVATTNWVSEVSICPSDGISNNIPLMNNLFISAGDRYAYVITDENRRIKLVHFEDSYNFEGSGEGTDFVYGLSYSGVLSYDVGDPIGSITANGGCVQLSSSELFLTVTKDGCVPETASISGKIVNHNGDGIAGVSVSLNTGATEMTASDGTYTFADLPLDNPYTITPTKEGNVLNGVSAQDLVIISRHILGLQLLGNEYLVLAADANQDQKVSAIDIINFLNLIIGKTSTLSGDVNWRFVPASHTFESSTPYEFFEKDVVPNLTSDVTDLDFIGVKLGDASGNASTN